MKNHLKDCLWFYVLYVFPTIFSFFYFALLSRENESKADIVFTGMFVFLPVLNWTCPVIEFFHALGKIVRFFAH